MDFLGAADISKKVGKIALSPNYFVPGIILSVIWPNTILLLVMLVISPKYFVMFLESPKKNLAIFYITFL